jgi:hypothetical protein
MEPMPTKEAPMQSISIRFATHDDAPALEWVAQRDSRRLPAPPHLVGEVDKRIVVVLSLASGAAVADPFTRTAELREMLAVRAAQLAKHPRPPLVRRWLPGYPRLEAR